MNKHISLPIATVGTVVIAVCAALASYYGTVNSQIVQHGQLETEVAVLQNSQAVQDSEITSMNSTLVTMNNNIIKLLVHAGVQPSNPTLNQ